MDDLATMPWPAIFALSEGKGTQMSFAEFTEMLAKKQREKNNSQVSS